MSVERFKRYEEFRRTIVDRVYKRPEGPLPDDVAATRRLLGMTEESIRRDVGELGQWLRDQPDLPNALDGGETHQTTSAGLETSYYARNTRFS